MRTTSDKRREVKTLIHSLGLVQSKHAALVPDLLADIEELESRLEWATLVAQAALVKCYNLTFKELRKCRDGLPERTPELEAELRRCISHIFVKPKAAECRQEGTP